MDDWKEFDVDINGLHYEVKILNKNSVQLEIEPPAQSQNFKSAILSNKYVLFIIPILILFISTCICWVYYLVRNNLSPLDYPLLGNIPLSLLFVSSIIEIISYLLIYKRLSELCNLSMTFFTCNFVLPIPIGFFSYIILKLFNLHTFFVNYSTMYTELISLIMLFIIVANAIYYIAKLCYFLSSAKRNTLKPFKTIIQIAVSILTVIGIYVVNIEKYAIHNFISYYTIILFIHLSFSIVFNSMHS